MSEKFDKAFWEERYRNYTAPSGRQPDPKLVAEVGDLAPGRALDAGCGEGANAIWLASRGWRVTAVDFAPTALRRAQEHAEALGADITSRIDWVEADLTDWTPAEERFDLVCADYVHTTASREALLRRLVAAVAPGGTLLIADHHPADQQPTSAYAPPPEVHVTPEEAAVGLDPDRWEIAVADARSRSVTGPDGHPITMHATVLRARKRS